MVFTSLLCGFIFFDIGFCIIFLGLLFFGDLLLFFVFKLLLFLGSSVQTRGLPSDFFVLLQGLVGDLCFFADVGNSQIYCAVAQSFYREPSLVLLNLVMFGQFLAILSKAF